jgi:erythromycin esterase-like protein
MEAKLVSRVLGEIGEIGKASPVLVIGIGEHAHGELVSWRWRLAIMRELRSRGHTLAVLCENLDAYVKGLNEGDPLRIDPKWGTFHPNLIADSDRSREHMAITEEVRELSSDIYGIDVQALDFPQLPSRPRVALQLARHKKRWGAATNTEARGSVRNALNAETIERMAKEFPTGTIVLYFAHDEHVALSCDAMRENQKYATDGSLLRKSMGLRYRSIGTYAPSLWSHWGACRGYKTPRRTVETDETTKRYCATAKHEVFVMPKRRPALSLGDVYKPADFDYMLCDKRRNAIHAPLLTPHA